MKITEQFILLLAPNAAAAFNFLAIADGGKPSYDEQTAQRIANMGIPCFACTPEKLPQLLEWALKGQDLTSLITDRKQQAGGRS